MGDPAEPAVNGQGGRSIYNKLLPEEAMDYERHKVALLEKYDFTERGYREKFQEARPERHESPSQFIFRLKNYFT